MKRLIFFILILIYNFIFSFQIKDVYKENYPELLGKCEPIKIYDKDNSSIVLHTLFRHDVLAQKNANYLNNKNSEVTLNNTTIDVDRTFYLRRILDFSLEYKCKSNFCDKDIINLYSTFRNQTLAGKYASTLSVDNTYLTLSTLPLYGYHNHSYPQCVIWALELWISVALGETNSFLKMGLFPFSLGRGIVLGAAYEIDFFGTASLAFDPTQSINQFAPGILLTGYLLDNILSYDLYLGFLRALGDPETSLKINKAVKNQSQYHYVQNKIFTVRNPAIAGRLKFEALKNDCKNITLEPYFFINMPRDQILEHLIYFYLNNFTIGSSGECFFENFDFGFDLACGFYKLFRSGSDNNTVVTNLNNNGFSIANNTQVLDMANNNELAIASCDNQKEIKSVSFSVLNNDQQISDTPLVNLPTRFEHLTHYIGNASMCTFDIAYSCWNRKIRFKFAVGFASGSDLIPNRTSSTSSDYYYDTAQFQPTQSVYNGQRVKSGFLMSGIGSDVVRVKSFPSPSSPNPYPIQESDFTNLVYVGNGIDFKIFNNSNNPIFIFNPNVLWFWQDVPTKLPTAYVPGKGKMYADKYLGLEFNTFLKWNCMGCLDFFLLAAWFFPGQYYKDIEGFPLNSDQQIYFDNLAQGITDQLIVPTVGSNMSWGLNAGFIYNF